MAETGIKSEQYVCSKLKASPKVFAGHCQKAVQHPPGSTSTAYPQCAIDLQDEDAPHLPQSAGPHSCYYCPCEFDSPWDL
eukprot:scaffold61869_cov15-Prasinocladus_malaysianus.AAC.1